MLSIGLVVSELTGDGSILLWLLWALAGAVFLNVFVRIGMVCRHFSVANPTTDAQVRRGVGRDPAES